MAYTLKQSTQTKVDVVLIDNVSGVELTGVTRTSVNIKAMKSDGTVVDVAALLVNGDWIEVGSGMNGLYRINLPASVTNTLGVLVLYVWTQYSNIVKREYFVSTAQPDDVTTVQTGVSSLQTSMTTVLSNQTTLQSGVTSLQSNMTTVLSNQTTLQSGVSSLQTSMTTALADLTTLQASVTTVQTLAQFLKDFHTGRWVVDSNAKQFIVYKSNGLGGWTEIARFDLKDASGNPSATSLFDRIPV